MTPADARGCNRVGKQDNTADSDTTAELCARNAFPPFGACLVIGIQRAGRRRSPDGYGLWTRTDGPERLRRPSHPPEFRRGTNACEHGSCHIRHHPLMSTADANRRGSAYSLMCGRSRPRILEPKCSKRCRLWRLSFQSRKDFKGRAARAERPSVIPITSLSCLRLPSEQHRHVHDRLWGGDDLLCPLLISPFNISR
jgi:hypothetical protein